MAVAVSLFSTTCDRELVVTFEKTQNCQLAEQNN